MPKRVLLLCNTFHIQPRIYGHFSRTFSSAAHKLKPDGDANKAYSDTLLLPKTPFKLHTDPKEAERKYRNLTCDELYRWQWENAKGSLFVLLDGPPYANGDLHMGHALNKITKDIINRFYVSQGRKVHYVPGWDCHGLPIEGKAMKDMKRSPHETPAAVIREASERTALREINSQKEQFRKLAIMADWDSKENTYRTLDRHYEIRQLRIFQKMVANGLIYRQHRPVYYSPSSRSALAEAELEYKDHVSESVYVAFDLDAEHKPSHHALAQIFSKGIKSKLLVWTTTPWTLTANMGIAVHEKVEYDVLSNEDSGLAYIVASNIAETALRILNLDKAVKLTTVPGSGLVGLKYKPLFEGPKSLDVIHAPHVTSDSGTGIVHIAPAHGAEDYNAFRALDLFSSSNAALKIVCHVDGKGQFTSDVATVMSEDDAMSLIGKDVLSSGNKAVLHLLQQRGKIVTTEKTNHKYPYDWRTKKPTIVIATSQWFANLNKIKDDAMTALQAVTFFPPNSRNRLESFVQSRSEWCISRQRVWGVPIPALHHKHSDRVVLDAETLEYIINAMESKGLDWWTSPIGEFVPPWLLKDGESAAETWSKAQDTMDVWFDSGTSWSMLCELGVGKCDEAGRQFDADLCLEGSDQHRGWFQSQLLTAIAIAGSEEKCTSPYGTLITHGMVLDEKGRKMSKSLGNVISPATIQQSTDVLRLWAATVEYWKDMSIGPTILAQVAQSYKKIRNTARFCLGNVGHGPAYTNFERVSRSRMGLAERFVMNELYNVEQTALEGYTTYNFPKVIAALNNFANITMSSLYFDITKDCLYANDPDSLERRMVVTVLEQVLNTMTRIMAPICPYLAEEIHATWKADGKSVFLTPWVPLSSKWKDPEASQNMEILLSLRGTVLSLLEKARQAKQISSSLEAEVDIVLPNDIPHNSFVELLQREQSFLKTLFIVSDTVITDEGCLGCTSPDWLYTSVSDDAGESIAIRVRPATLQKCPRCWAFTRLEDEAICRRCVDVIR